MRFMKNKTERDLRAELARVQARLAEAEATMKAIHRGEVDAIVLDGRQGSRIFTLQSPEEPYRLLAERMNEGAATLTVEGTILFCNRRLAEMVGLPAERLLGSRLSSVLRENERQGFPELVRRALKNDVRAEGRMLRSDGTVFPVQLSLSWIPLEESGQGVCLVATDLSDQKHAEAAARQSENRYRTLLESLPQMVFAKDSSSRYISGNGNFAKLLGIRPEEFAGKTDYDFFNPALAEKYRADDQRVMHLGVAEEIVEEYKRNGDAMIVQTVKAPFRDADGNTIGVLGIFWDTTARRQAEQKAREQAALLDLAHDAIIFRGLDSRILFWSRGAKDLYGWPAEEVLGKVVHELLQTEFPDSLEAIHTCIQETREWAGELKHISRDGKVILVASRWSLLRDEKGNPTAILEINRDITERKRAEEELRRSEERYRSIVAAIAEGVVVQQADGKIIACNRSAERILGVPADELLGQTSVDRLQSAIHEDGSPFLGETHPPMVVLRTGKPASNVCMGIRRPDGGLSWILINAEPMYHNADKIPYAVVSTFTDDTKRREAEEQVRKASLYTRSLIEASPDPMLVISPEGKITDVNVAAETVTGLSREHLIGSDFCDYFSEPEQARKSYQQVFERGSVHDYPLAIRRVSGHITHVLYNATLFKNEAGQVEGVFAAARDISERKILEEQLLQAQKLEAVGQLAGGVAHDFNNLLGVILGSSELLLADLSANDPRRQYVEDITAASKRGASLTKRLLAFSRKQVLSPRVCDLNSIVKETGHVLPRLIGEHIEIDIVLSVERAPVLADPTQVQQVLMNLAANARDAMPEGGKLTIEVANYEVKEGGREAVDVAHGHYVTLTVSDTGVGMSPQIQRHVFDPFFTTKDLGKGTGLGLSTVYGIVKESGGSILANSKAGEGTTFRIYLPRAKKEIIESVATSRVPDESLQGSETILLVEDQSELRNLTRKFLQRLGYNVLDTGFPKEAIEIAQRFAGTIDLLLTDVLMPGMNGRELAKRLRPLYADMRILYVSGFDDQILEEDVADANDAFMQKPFHIQELATKLREILRAPKSASYTETKQKRAS